MFSTKQTGHTDVTFMAAASVSTIFSDSHLSS